MITITLTAYNMGPETTEEDFDAWRRYVCDHIDEALGFRVDEVDQYPFECGPAVDSIHGATDKQRDAIRSWLAVDGWDAFCADRDEALTAAA